MNPTASEIYRERGGTRLSGGGYLISCPVPGHGRGRGDKNPSLSIADGSKGLVVHCKGNCDQLDVLRALGCDTKSNGAASNGARPRPNGKHSSNGANGTRHAEIPAKPKAFYDQHLIRDGYRHVADYDYVDLNGEVLNQVRRYENPDKPETERKKFLQRSLDERGGWLASAGSRKVLYRWSDFAKHGHKTVYVCEGEKDADRLASLDLLATTVASGSWSEEAIEALRGYDCFVLEDNDKPGRKKALDAAKALHGVARSVRIMRLPGLGEGEDISDWLDAGNPIEALQDIAMAAPVWQPDDKAHVETTSSAGTETDGLVTEDSSRSLGALIADLLKQGFNPETIAQRLLDKSKKIPEPISGQLDPKAYVEQQIQTAIKELDFDADKGGRPYKDSQANIRIALLKLGVSFSFDQFEDRGIIKGLKGHGPFLDDPAAARLWLLIDEKFQFRPTQKFFITVIEDAARLNSFHPVKSYLNDLKWDGQRRLDTWLTRYAGAEDTPYTRGVGAVTLMAAVRRIREPGCKFDEMLYLISEKQGLGKSKLWRELAVNPERFSDNLELDASGKQVIEKTRGKWIVESSDLSGINGKTVDHLKALLSRQDDEDRMAYDRFTKRRPRQFIIVGTSNETKALRDPTGNRRFWPVTVSEIDLEAIRKERNQLWAEAAVREAAWVGEVRLPAELWEAAAAEQEKNTLEDPWHIALRDAFDEAEQEAAKKKLGLRVAAQSVWRFLGLTSGRMSAYDFKRVSDVMKKLGWERPNSAGTYSENKKIVTGYVKGSRGHYLTVELPLGPF